MTTGAGTNHPDLHAGDIQDGSQGCLRTNHGFLLASNRGVRREGTQLTREKVGMLKALVTWEEDALAVSPGLGYGTVRMQPPLRAESS